MNRVKHFAGATVSLMIAGCGGSDGSSSGNSYPVVTSATPSSSVTPTPTSTACPLTTSASTTLLNFSGNLQFNTYESVLRYTRQSNGAVILANTAYAFSPTADQSFQENGTSGNIYYFFNGSSVPPYNIYPNFYVAPFLPSNRISSLSNSAYSAYRTTSGGAVYTLTRLNPGAGNTQLSLAYLGLGTVEATNTDANTGAVTTDYRAFGYGFPAEVNAIPKSGIGQYSGIVVGRAISVSGSVVYQITGSISMMLDFSAQNYSGTVVINGVDDRTGENTYLGSFNISNTVSYPTALGNISAYIGQNKESFRAYLGGGAAEELEGSFAMTIPDPKGSGLSLMVVGAVGARR